MLHDILPALKTVDGRIVLPKKELEAAGLLKDIVHINGIRKKECILDEKGKLFAYVKRDYFPSESAIETIVFTWLKKIGVPVTEFHPAYILDEKGHKQSAIISVDFSYGMNNCLRGNFPENIRDKFPKENSDSDETVFDYIGKKCNPTINYYQLNVMANRIMEYNANSIYKNVVKSISEQTDGSGDYNAIDDGFLSQLRLNTLVDYFSSNKDRMQNNLFFYIVNKNNNVKELRVAPHIDEGASLGTFDNEYCTSISSIYEHVNYLTTFDGKLNGLAMCRVLGYPAFGITKTTQIGSEKSHLILIKDIAKCVMVDGEMCKVYDELRKVDFTKFVNSIKETTGLDTGCLSEYGQFYDNKVELIDNLIDSYIKYGDPDAIKESVSPEL